MELTTEKLIKIDIVSAEERIFSGEAAMVIATGGVGEMGITYGHTQLLTTLKPGLIRVIQKDQDEQVFYVSGGMLEVQPTIVTVLADTIIRADDIDAEAAEEARQKAEKALSNKERKAEFEFAEAASALAEAAAQIRAVQQLRKKLKR